LVLGYAGIERLLIVILSLLLTTDFERHEYLRECDGNFARDVFREEQNREIIKKHPTTCTSRLAAREPPLMLL
jgi:hypothetical protein